MIKRGDIWWVRFASSQGSEILKDRPAVVISNDASNLHLSRVQVIPMSRQIEKVFPCEALVALNNMPCKAMADQIATISKSRLINKAGSLKPKELVAVETALRIQLNLL